MAKEFCRNRFYQTKPISHLPHEYRFADGSKSLVIDYATTDQLGQCRKMIEEAALRGDNVGVDEYENASESTELLFSLSEIFQASDTVSRNVEAFMFIQPCQYQRSYDSCTASVYVFRTKDIDDGVYSELMSLVADFAKAIDIGYTQCFTHVALCLHGIYTQLRRKGFLTVALLPNWVNIAGASSRDNAIMIKDFGLPDRPLRSQEEVVRMLERCYSTPERVFEEYTSVDLPQIPGLPNTFVTESGTKLVLRNLRKDEDHLLYEMFSDAERNGEGCVVHEFPSLDAFRLDVLSLGYGAVIEEERTHTLIGYLVFKDADMSRSGKQKVCDFSIITRAEIRGMGFGKKLFSMALYVETLLGYEMEVGDALHTNNRIQKLLTYDPDTVLCGVLPKVGFQKGVGWVDAVLDVREVKNKLNLDLRYTFNSSKL